MTLRLIVLAFWFSTTSLPAQPMDFSTVMTPDGLRIVSGKGAVVAGDAERLAVILGAADRDAFGNKRMALNSSGGLVGEALAMVTVMDEVRVTTIVEPNAECASACAQVLFLSGVQRFVLDGGRLGLHSCYLKGRAAKAAKSALCNDLIAQNALAHGTDYASIMTFMRYANGVRWFDAEEVDCWGFSRWPPGSNRGIQTGETPPCLLRGYNGKSSSEPAPPSR